VGLSSNTQRFDTALRCGDQVAGHPDPTRPVSLGPGPPSVGLLVPVSQLAAPSEPSKDYRRPANERHPFLSVGQLG
jgi:hypothetical protein